MTNAALLRPAWTPLTIAAMVIGFMLAWPLGLAMLAYILWGDNISFFKDKFKTAGENFSGKCERKAKSWQQTSRTGNVAFDDWREAELQRLDEERKKLDDMMQEFDDYSREFSTEGLIIDDTRTLNDTVRTLILEDLSKDQKLIN